MAHYDKTPRSTVKRIPKRGQYDADTVHAILDAGRVCHVGFVVDGQPFVIPTAYGREGRTLYLHGATTSRLMAHLGQGVPACVAVTHLDGIVLARSLFHHSLNYRSVVAFGTARLLTSTEERDHALAVVSEQMLRGRWAEARHPNAKEHKATAVLALEMEEASAKVRTGGPNDDAEDYALPVWAGVLPMQEAYGPPVPDAVLPPDRAVAASVAAAVAQGPLCVTPPPVPEPSMPGTDEYASFYAGYVGQVAPGQAGQALATAWVTTPLMLAQIPEAHWGHAYMPGKWSIRELVLHVIDTERIMAYRLLRIARGDGAALPGFDEQVYAAHSGAAQRSGPSLIEEYRAVRLATLHLLAHTPEAAWANRGTASGHTVSARALAYILAGHERHHWAVLRGRYF